MRFVVPVLLGSFPVLENSFPAPGGSIPGYLDRGIASKSLAKRHEFGGVCHAIFIEVCLQHADAVIKSLAKHEPDKISAGSSCGNARECIRPLESVA